MTICAQVAAHGPSGAWGTLAVALFADKHCADSLELTGLFFGGGEAAWRLLGVQALSKFQLPLYYRSRCLFAAICQYESKV